MSRWNLIALTLGLLLVAAPFSKNQLAWADEEYEDEDDDEEAAPTDSSEKDVVVATVANWEDTIGNSKFALVEFYAPWCGHCKNLAPHYAKAATALKDAAPEVVIAKVDATQEESLGTQYEVKGYPTLKWFIDGELASDYNGPRDAEGIIAWVKRKTGPPAVTIDDVDALKAKEEESPVLVVGYFKHFEGKKYDAFVSYAKKVEDVTFVQTTSSDVAKAAGIKHHDHVAAVKNHEGEERETVKFDGDITDADALKAFVNGEKLPLTIEFTQTNSEKIFNSGIPQQLILWADAATLAADHEVMKAYKAAAKKYKGKLVFVVVNNEGDSAEPVTNFFGLKGAEGPVLLGFWMEKSKKYRLHETLTTKHIEKFASGILDGSVQPEYKSAPIPEGDDAYDGGVAIIVGKNVDSVVKDTTKDVLLEVYAPWCGHCKKLDPIYKKLAKRFKKVDSVVIAKMDGTENEHPDIDVKGFPTLMFFPAGEDQTPIPFEGGDRSLKALTKFIKQHATIAYDLPKKGGSDSPDTEESTDAAAPGKEGHDEL